MTNEQIEYFGKEAAKTYLEEGVELNSTITKLAEEHALNKHEIDRIVEAANTNTYLSIFNNIEDKYVEFPVADAEKVAESLSPESETNNYLDYDTPPEKEIEEVQIFPVEDAEKVSSVQANPYSSENLQLHQRMKYAEQQLIDKLSLSENAFSEESENLYRLVKQAVLEGTCFGHIKSAMEQHSPGKYVEIFTEKTSERLKNEDRRIDLSDTNEKLGTVNENNEIIKKLNTIHAITEEVDEANEKLASLGGLALKQLARAPGALFNTAKGFARAHPGLALGGAATATVGTGLFAGKLAKDKAELELSAIRSIPEKYKKR